MNKSIILSLFIVTTCFLSCNDALDEIPKSFVARSNYYKTLADAEGALVSAYNTNANNYYGINHFLLLELQGDFLEGRGSQATISQMDKVFDQMNIGRAAEAWSTYYSGINRCNAVIENVSKMTEINEKMKNSIVAEAYFLRAMRYFDLVRRFGAVPLRLTETVDLNTIASPRIEIAKVYQQIISDALEAEKNITESVGENTGRASKPAVKMLLAQVYLTMEEWEKAAEKADEVIINTQYSLVSVNEPDDFYKIYASESNSEDIYSEHHSVEFPTEMQSYMHRPNTPPYNYSSAGYFAWLPNTKSYIGSGWDEKDLRKSFNLYTKYLDNKGEWIDLPEISPILFKKYITDKQGYKKYTVPIMRYTEAFLIYAEAACMAAGSPTPLALERLNSIKRRAYGYDYSVPSPVDYSEGMSKEKFREVVIQERGYEFLLEQKRWFDLVRTGTVEKAFAEIGKKVAKERMLWPIPEAEINNNPALSQADQNPGY